MTDVPLPGMVPVARVVCEFLIDADQVTIYVSVSSYYADGTLHSLSTQLAGDSPAIAARSALVAATDLLEEHVRPF